MSLTFPGPVACQHNCDKSSSPLRQNQCYSKSHTPPDKRDASSKGNPPPENQQEPQVIQDKNNGKNTPSSNLSDLSIAAAVIWLMLIKTPALLLLKQLASLTGNTWGALQCVWWNQNDSKSASRTFKVLTHICAKIINIMPLYVGPYSGN